MALTEEQLEIISDAMLPLFQYLESQVIIDVAKRIKSTMSLTRTSELMVENMQKLGYSPAKIRQQAMKLLKADPAFQKEVAENTLAYKKKVKELLEEVRKEFQKRNDTLTADCGDMSYFDDLKTWEQGGKKLQDNSFLPQMVHAIQKQTADTVKNLTQTTGFKNMYGYEAIMALYQKELDKAMIKLCTGTFSKDQIVYETVHSLAESGLRTIDFSSGWSMQLDTAVKLAVRTGNHQLSGKIMDANIMQTDENLVYVSKHWGARNKGTGHANHQEWQGKVYFVREGQDYTEEARRIGQDYITDLWYATGYSVTGERENDPLGLYGYNCRHSHYVWFEGVSNYPHEDPEPKPVTVKGKTYDYYALTQKQRTMERSVRALKREREAMKALGMDTKDITKKIRRKMAEYEDFCKDAKVKANINRMRYEPGTSNLKKTEAWKKYEDAFKELKFRGNGETKVVVKEPVPKYKTFDEYEAYLQKTYGVGIDKDVRELNLAAVQEAFMGTEEVLADFLDAKPVFGGLNTHNRAIMSVSPIGEVCYNPKWFRTYQEAYNGCISDDNYHPYGSSIRSSGYHEAGHILELTLIKKYAATSFEETIRLYQNGTYAEKIIKQALSKISSQRGVPALIEEVSRYAHKNYSECMAECVADYYLNRGSAAILSRQVIKELRRAING